MQALAPDSVQSNESIGQAGVRRDIRVLSFTSLFPSPARPRHGIFVKTRLTHLARDFPVDVRVVAPVPWFPLTWRAFGSYADLAATPRAAVLDSGHRVSYPRYAMLPRLGVPLQPSAMAAGAAADVRALYRSGWVPDLIDAHYFYPDGVAAAILARRLKLPLVITARGTDVNVLAKQAGPGRRILQAAHQASAIVAVSSRLKDELVTLGADADKIVVLRNGVDLDVFKPWPREPARAALGLGGAPLALCVGNLKPEKGFDLAIRALAAMPDWQLLIVGEGPLHSALSGQARQLGLSSRVQIRQNMPQQQLAQIYSAADVLMLTSLREGWPNVVLESLACGTPVIAADVGAVGEMLTTPEAGRIVAAREPGDFAGAAIEIQRAGVDPDQIRSHARSFDWATISRGQWELLQQVLGRAGSGG